MTSKDVTRPERREPALAEALRQAGDGVLVIDRELRTVFANAAARRIAGIQDPAGPVPLTEEVWGRAQRVDGRWVPRDEWAIVRAVSGHEVHSTWSRMVRADGTSHDILLSARPIRDAGKKIVGAVATFSDATRLAQRRRSRLVVADEARFLRTLDNLHEGFQIIGFDWRYLYVNPAAARQGQRRPDELHGRTMMECYPGIEKTEFFATLRRCMEGRTTASFENPFRLPDGSLRHFDLRVQPVPEGLCLFSVDVEDRKEAAFALLRANQALESRVAERTRELEAANRELEAFSYSVSHDLRAPLRAIDGFSLALAEDLSDRLAPAEREHLTRIRDAARRMAHLIDDLLDLARVARFPLEVADVDLSQIATAVLGELRAAEPGRDVVTGVAPGVVARGDARLLRIVLTNLLDNAWKYTAQRPGARIDFRAEEVGGERVYVVEDEGIGFDPAYGHKLFGIFQRLHSSAEYPGTGVGLAIVQRIVARHGGRVWGEGRPGRGATFRFALGSAEPVEGRIQ